KLASNRLEIIYNKRKSDGMNDELIEHLSRAIRTSTNKAYEEYWKKYAEWCQKNNHQADSYDSCQLLYYLTSQNHLQCSTLNGYRSAISSVLRDLYPKRKPIAEDPGIVAFFRAKRLQEIAIPSETKLETWDMNQLRKFVQSRF
ncbi:MAG: hypothetical protein EXX96DRAFT_461407, partial [Benjaminiella poitrasii]